MDETLKAVRQCVTSHRVKAAFQRVLKDCGLDESDFDNKAKLLAHLMYVQGRDDQLTDTGDAMAEYIGETK
jgi:hypothetical protein